MPPRLVKALDVYVAHVTTERPPQRVLYTRQEAIRDLLSEALHLPGIPDEPENDSQVDESRKEYAYARDGLSGRDRRGD